MYNVYDVFFVGIPSHGVALPNSSVRLCMMYPLYHVSSSVSVVIALFFLVALYVYVYVVCMASSRIFFAIRWWHTYIHLRICLMTHVTFAAVVKLLVSSPPLNPTSIYASPSSCQKSHEKRRNCHFVRSPFLLASLQEKEQATCITQGPLNGSDNVRM